MRLPRGHHLAYCTNIHPAETWAECLAALKAHALPVRERVGAGHSYAIGLRLSDLASRELSQPETLLAFRRWLDRHDCYVFTINGFPFGRFHGVRVKEQVYLPDWTSRERLEYTNRLFDILAQLLPEGISGSVSTVPGSFKEFISRPEQAGEIRRHLRACVAHIEKLSGRSGRELHLGLEPEPLCLLETTRETVDFFDQFREEPGIPAEKYLGVNYDACHLAVEFEDATKSLELLKQHGVKISKIHLSNALKIRRGPVDAVTTEPTWPREASLAKLGGFADDTYLHQTIVRDSAGQLSRHRDLGDFLNSQFVTGRVSWEEARVHFHIPLHTPPGAWFETTSDHLRGVLDVLQKDPDLCSHLEMETYTWGVLPPELKSRDVSDQLAAEYHWCLQELGCRGLA